MKNLKQSFQTVSSLKKGLENILLTVFTVVTLTSVSAQEMNKEIENQKSNKLYLSESVIEDLTTIDTEKMEFYCIPVSSDFPGKKVKLAEPHNYPDYLSMIDPEAKSIKDLVSRIDPKKSTLEKAIATYNLLKAQKIKYIHDPCMAKNPFEFFALESKLSEIGRSPIEASIKDYVKHPEQTVEDKGGDCEDLSILYSSALLAKKIQAGLIMFQNHVIPIFKVNEKDLKTNNIENYLKDRYGNYWLAVEVSSIGEKNFFEALQEGYINFLRESPCYRIVFNSNSHYTFDKTLITKSP